MAFNDISKQQRDIITRFITLIETGMYEDEMSAVKINAGWSITFTGKDGNTDEGNISITKTDLQTLADEKYITLTEFNRFKSKISIKQKAFDQNKLKENKKPEKDKEHSIQKIKRRNDPLSGLTLSLAFFVSSILLYFKSDFFGSWTRGIALLLIVIGLIGFGVEIEKQIKKNNKKIKEIEIGGGFDNLGVGLAILVICLILTHNFPMVWLNALLSFLYFLSLYGIILGISNIILRFAHKNEKIEMVSSTNNQFEKGQNQSKPIIKAILLFSGIVGFIASIIQILQFLKII